jgi:peptidoglycan hydrolase CwlO-like protein
MSAPSATMSRRPPQWRRMLTRRNAGRTMIVVACVGLITSITGVVVGWRLLGQLETNVDESLALTGEALVSLDASLDVADSVIASVAQGLTTVEATLTTVDTTFHDGTTVLDDVATTTEQLPPSFARLDQALANAQDAAGVIDDALNQLDRLPLGINLRSDAAIAPSIQQVRNELGPLARNLDAATDDLRQLSTSSTDVSKQIGELRADVQQVNQQLARSSGLIDSYRQTATEAQDLARRSRSDLGDDITLSQVLLVVLGVAVAVGQIVPFWVGRELLLEHRVTAEADQPDG